MKASLKGGLDREFSRIAFDESPIGVAVVSAPDSTLLRVNPAFCDFLGYSQQELVGRSVQEITHPDDRAATTEAMRELVVHAKVMQNLEKRYLHKSGAVVWGAVYGRDVVGADGTVSCTIAQVLDITQRKQTEERLQESETRFQNVMSLSRDLIYRRDLKLDRYDLLSPAVEAITGFSAAEFAGLSFAAVMERFHPDDRPALKAWVERTMAGEAVQGIFEYRFKCKDGSYHWFADSSTAVIGPDGKPRYHVGVVRDVTARKEAEEALRRREQEFQTLAENAPDIIVRFDRQFRPIYANRVLFDRLGIQSMAQILGKTQRELGLSAESATLWENHLQKVFTSRQAQIFEYVPAANQDMCLQVRLVPELNAHGKVVTALCVARDISELKQMDAALRESGRRLTAVLNASSEPIMLLDRKGGILTLNDAMKHRLGGAAAELPGHDAFSLLSAELAQTRRARLEQVFQSGRVVRFDDERNGRCFEHTYYPVLEESGRVSTVAVYSMDITARKLAERTLQQTNEELEHKVRERTAELLAANQTLRAGEARFRALFEQAGVAVVLVDSRTGCFVQVNQKCCDFVGYTVEEMLQLNFKDITHPDDLANDLVHAKLLNEGKIREFSYEKRYYHKSGRIVWGLLSMTPLWMPGEPAQYRVAVVEDITERKQMEQHLQQANADLALRAAQLRKLAADLTLAEQRERQRVSGVLHDGLQQLLIAARFRLGFLMEDPDQTRRQTVAVVEDLIKQSLTCSRTLVGELSPPILKERGLLPAMEWLAGWMEEKHGLTVHYSADAMVNPHAEDLTILLFQSVRELLLNIVKHAQVKSASVEVRCQADRLSIHIIDQGVGFDATRIQSDQQRGTGLGLPSIRERLEILGGALRIQSMPGQGCRCILTVPVQGKATVTGAPGSGQVRRLRVLTVDDHLVIRQALVRLISEAPDIEVVGEASNGEEAVELIRRLRPDVVTMDVQMKGLGGIEATRIIHAELPQVAVIGLTMFEDPASAAAMRQAGAVDYLTKSSPADVLIAAIRTASGFAGLAACQSAGGLSAP